MRLEGQKKMGYFPAPPEAVSSVMQYLCRPAEESAILCAIDPCAGAGAALEQLCRGFKMIPYAIELDERRAIDCHARFDGWGCTLAPASFFGCTASTLSFSLGWVNPPYDDEIGGGMRTEATFLQRATQWLRPGGIMCFVIPEHVVSRHDVRSMLCQWYTRLATLPFPEEHRQYDEIVVIGIKRARAVESYSEAAEQVEEAMHLPPDPDNPYLIPTGIPPKRFEKFELTEAEIAREFSVSGLLKLLDPPPEPPLPAPPLPLSTGHLALLLAAGHLDGVVRPDGEQPHVVRGTASKKTYIASQEEIENKDGSVTLKTVQSEKIILTVRLVEEDGNIVTLQQE
jgi:hypothetical protein